MSKFTTEVRFICETLANNSESTGETSIDEILKKSAPKLFNFDFPIFDEKYRLPLEIKILRHYYTREISEETVGLWKLRLQCRLNEIMPLYNKLYKSELISFNPLYDTDEKHTIHKILDGSKTNKGSLSSINNNEKNNVETNDLTTNSNMKNSNDKSEKNITTTTFSENNKTQNSELTVNSDNETLSTKNQSNSTNSTSGKNNRNGNNWDYYSDTPQGNISGVDEITYLTNLRKQTNLENETNSSESTNNSSNSTDSETNKNTNNNKQSLNKVDKNSDNIENSKNDITEQGNTTETNKKTGTVSFDETSTSNTASTTTNQTNISNVEEYIDNVVGKKSTVSFSKMLIEFRKTFLNIDMDIINDLQNLFFTLWE